MPTRTQANQRITEIQYEEAVNTPLPTTPRVEQKERLPLGELAGGGNEQIPIVIGINLKSTKSNRKKRNNKENFRRPEVIEDEYESSSSSAVEEVRRLLRRSGHNNAVNIYLDSRPQTPLSKAAKAARRKLSPASPVKTPQRETEIRTSPANASHRILEQPSIPVGRPRSPPRINPGSIEVLEDDLVAKPCATVAVTPISSNSQNTSPKRSPRIEDSVTAIDVLSEVLEELEASLPVVLIDNQTKPIKAVSVSPPSKPSANTTKKRVASAPTRKRPATTSVQVASAKTLVAKPSTTASPASKKSLDSKPRSRTSRLSPPAREAMAHPLVTIKAPTSRVASITKAPFTPAKSNRAPTKPNFTLPGDAITAKKKAAHEAKLKQEEEENKAKRDFKARPVPARNSLGGVTVPRPTIASQKRKSFVKGLGTEITSLSISTVKRNDIPRSAPGPGTHGRQAIQISKSSTNKASISGGRPATKSSAAAAVSAKQSTTTTPTRKADSTPKVPVATGRSPVSVTKPLTPEQKAQAAKKARADAAERGRLASREWAEKQRKKRESPVAAGEAKEE